MALAYFERLPGNTLQLRDKTDSINAAAPEHSFSLAWSRTENRSHQGKASTNDEGEVALVSALSTFVFWPRRLSLM